MKRRRRRVGAISRMAGDLLEGALLEQPNMTEESANLLLSPESIQYDSGRHEHTFEHNEHGLQAKAVGTTDMVNALQEYFGYLERGANILDENRLLKLQLPKQISVRHCCCCLCMYVCTICICMDCMYVCIYFLFHSTLISLLNELLLYY